MKTKWIIIPTLLATSLFLGGAGLAATTTGHALGSRFAQTRIGRLVSARLGRLLTLKSELNLTDAQRQAVTETLQAHRTEIVSAVQPVISNRRALRDAVLADSPDEKAIRAAADNLGKSLGDAAVTLSKVKTDLKAKAGLSPDQQKLITDFRAQNDADVDRLLGEINSQ